MSRPARHTESYKDPPKLKPASQKPVKSYKRPISFQSKPPLVSSTPNFGRNPYQPDNSELKSEESLDISEISKEKLDSSPFFLDENQPKPKIHSSIQTHLYKYNKAFTILTTDFQKYQSSTDQKLLSIHEHVASVKNSIKVHLRVKENLEKSIRSSVKTAKSALSQEFSAICQEITNSCRYSKGHIDELHQLQECYDQKLQENENYLQSFSHPEQSRSKSSITHYFSALAEENKRLRADLSKLWNKS